MTAPDSSAPSGARRRRLRLQPANIAEIFAGAPGGRGRRQGGRRRRGAPARDAAQARRHHARPRDAAMDGFTFLRILMSKQPTPVIVVSSLRAKGERLQGARARRARLRRQARSADSPDARELREQILAKVLLVRTIRRARPPPPTRRRPSGISRRRRSAALGRKTHATCSGDYAPRWIVAIASFHRRTRRRCSTFRHARSRRARRDSSSRSTCPTSSRARSPSGSTSAGPSAFFGGAGRRLVFAETRLRLPGPAVHGGRDADARGAALQLGRRRAAADRYVPSARSPASAASPRRGPRGDRHRAHGDGRRRRRRCARDPRGRRNRDHRIRGDRRRATECPARSCARASRPKR